MHIFSFSRIVRLGLVEKGPSNIVEKSTPKKYSAVVSITVSNGSGKFNLSIPQIVTSYWIFVTEKLSQVTEFLL